MKLLKTTFNRLNLTQQPVRYPLVESINPDWCQYISEAPLRELVDASHGDMDVLAASFDEEGIFLYDYGMMEPTSLPGVDVGEVHSFEFLFEVEPVTVYNKRSVMLVARGIVEGNPNDPAAKYHITSTMSYHNHEKSGETHLVNNALFCNSADNNDRTLRTVDGVNSYVNVLESEGLDYTAMIDPRGSFHAGVQVFDALEVSRSHYLSRIVSATIQAEGNNECMDVYTDHPFYTAAAALLNPPSVTHNPIGRALRSCYNEAHRTMCISGSDIKEIFGEAEATVYNGAIKIRPIADAWDNSIESKAAYTIFQYLHGQIANLGVETLELEIDTDGPVTPKYTTFKGMDKGAHTYADIIKVWEDVHDQFCCQGCQVTANINFNINGVSTVEITVDAAPVRILEYPSFASSYSNPLVTKDCQNQRRLGETFNTIREVISF